MIKKFLITVSVFLGVLLLVVLAGAYYLLATTKGAKKISKIVLAKYINAEVKSVQRVEGNFIQGISYKNVELQNAQGLPPGSLVRIQRLTVRLRSLDWLKMNAVVENGRLQLPSLGLVVFSGSYQDGLMDWNIYSKAVDVQELLGLLRLSELSNVSGSLRDVDVYIKGSLEEFQLSGQFYVEQLARLNFYFSDGPGTGQLTLKKTDEGYQPQGRVELASGKIKSQRMNLDLEPSRIDFTGSWNNPTFKMKGNSTVGKIKIHVSLQGTRQMPQLQLTSFPPLPESQLMLMVATGKTWGMVDNSINQNKISADAAKDFVDYFIFAGQGEDFAKQLGIKDVSLIYDQNAKGIEVKKEVSKLIDVGYQVERNEESGTSWIDQKLEGELKLTDSVSLSVDKDLKQNTNALVGSSLDPKPDDRVLLKFKKNF